MKFKHFTMEELNKMTQDQQRGYLILELVSGASTSLLSDVSKRDIYETQAEQVQEVTFLEDIFRKLVLLLKETMTADTERLEEMLQQSINANKEGR